MTLLSQLPADEVVVNDRLRDTLAAVDRIHGPEQAESWNVCPAHRSAHHETETYEACGDCARGELWTLCRCGFEDWPCNTVREVAEALELDLSALEEEAAA